MSVAHNAMTVTVGESLAIDAFPFLKPLRRLARGRAAMAHSSTSTRCAQTMFVAAFLLCAELALVE